jgi:hypothetical protein
MKIYSLKTNMLTDEPLLNAWHYECMIVDHQNKDGFLGDLYACFWEERLNETAKSMLYKVYEQYNLDMETGKKVRERYNKLADQHFSKEEICQKLDEGGLYQGQTKEEWEIHNKWADLHRILLFYLGINRCGMKTNRGAFLKHTSMWPGLAEFFDQKCRTYVHIHADDEDDC